MITETKHLSKQLASVKAAVAKRGMHGVLQCVRLTCHNGTATLSTTDLEIAAVVPLTVIEAPSNFDVVVPFAELEKVVKATSYDRLWVDETAEPEAYVMLADGSNPDTPVSVWIEPEHRAEDFPKLPVVEQVDQELTLVVDQLLAALDVVLPAASRDQSRPVLTGIAIDAKDRKITFVSTDSYRLHKAVVEGVSAGTEELRNVPHQLLKLVASYAKREKAQTVHLRFGTGRCEVGFDQTEALVMSRIIDGQFPRYQQLIPSGMEYLAGFDSEQLLLAIKHVDAVRASKVEPVVLHLTPKDGWHLSELHGKATVALTKANAGPWPEVGFAVGYNPEFLAGAVKAMGGETTIVEFNTALKPAVVSDKGDSTKMALVMPVRLSIHPWVQVEENVGTKVTYSGKTKGAQAVTKAVNAAADKGAEPVVEQPPTGKNSPSNQFLIEANVAMGKHYRVTDLKTGPEREVKELQRSYHNGLVAWYLGKRKTRPDAGALDPGKASVVKARVTRIASNHGIQAPGA